MHRALSIIGRFLVQACAFGGLALFVFAVAKLSTGGFGGSSSSDSVSDSGSDDADSDSAPEEDDHRPVIILDPGHGGQDGGTVAGGALEKALNIDTSNRVAKILEKKGVRVIFTRNTDDFVGLNDRARFGNKKPSALFVSIHHNASTSKIPRGIETYFSHPKPPSVQRAQRGLFGAKDGESFIDRRGEELARRVQLAVCNATGASDRGIKNHPFAVTRWVSAPSVLVECGFLSNPTECAKLRSEGYRDKLSQGIASGLLAYLKELESEPLLGISFPDRVMTPELADILPSGP